MSRRDESPASASPTQHPPAYRALRMAAEWASAVRDQQLNFAYDPGTGHMVLDDSGTGPTLPVFTRSFTSRPLVTGVEFSVPSDMGEPLTLEVSGDQVSALFWSESAVEKFLVPVYASVAADDAPRFLGRLFDAWYGYPADVVQVCAIAYLCGRQPPAEKTPLSLARTVGLVCLEEGASSPSLLTLDEFTERYSTGLARGGEGVMLGSGSPEVRHGWEITDRIESVVARDVAEFVSGMRGHFVAFSTEEATLVPVVSPDTSPPGIGGALFDALARPIRPDRPVPLRVVLHVDPVEGEGPTFEHSLIPGQGGLPTEFVPDSVFWTDGAVEKLLVPYYASVKGGDSWIFEACLMAKWDGRMKHPSSNSVNDLKKAIGQRLDRFGRAPGRDAEDPSSPVYATMHLPRSEYADLAGRTVVLWAQAGTSGTPEATVSPVWTGQGGVAAAAPAKRSRKTASRATEARKAGRSAR